jgi:hypothetical protein
VYDSSRDWKSHTHPNPNPARKPKKVPTNRPPQTIHLSQSSDRKSRPEVGLNKNDATNLENVQEQVKVTHSARVILSTGGEKKDKREREKR